MGTRKKMAALTVGIGIFLQLLAAGCSSQTARSNAATINYAAAMRAYQEGRSDQAMVLLNNAVQQNPDAVMPRAVLGDIYYAKGEHQKALVQYQALSKLDPYLAENHYKVGLTCQLLNRLQEALVSYLRALDLNPDDQKTNMNLGLVYLALGQPADAAKYIRRSTELNPQSAIGFANLAVALDAQGKFPEAEVAYRRSIELEAGQTITLLNFGANLTAQAKAAEAIVVLEEVIKKSDSPLARKRLGDALTLARKYDAAVAHYHKALKLSPGYYLALNEMGRAFIAQYKDGLELDDSKRMEALKTWRKSLALNAQQPRIQAMLKQWETKPLFAP